MSATAAKLCRRPAPAFGATVLNSKTPMFAYASANPPLLLLTAAKSMRAIGCVIVERGSHSSGIEDQAVGSVFGFGQCIVVSANGICPSIQTCHRIAPTVLCNRDFGMTVGKIFGPNEPLLPFRIATNGQEKTRGLIVPIQRQTSMPLDQSQHGIGALLNVVAHVLQKLDDLFPVLAQEGGFHAFPCDSLGLCSRQYGSE